MARPILVFCMMNIRISSETAETMIMSKLSSPSESEPTARSPVTSNNPCGQCVQCHEANIGSITNGIFLSNMAGYRRGACNESSATGTWEVCV